MAHRQVKNKAPLLTIQGQEDVTANKGQLGRKGPRKRNAAGKNGQPGPYFFTGSGRLCTNRRGSVDHSSSSKPRRSLRNGRGHVPPLRREGGNILAPRPSSWRKARPRVDVAAPAISQTRFGAADRLLLQAIEKANQRLQNPPASPLGTGRCLLPPVWLSKTRIICTQMRIATRSHGTGPPVSFAHRPPGLISQSPAYCTDYVRSRGCHLGPGLKRPHEQPISTGCVG